MNGSKQTRTTSVQTVTASTTTLPYLAKLTLVSSSLMLASSMSFAGGGDFGYLYTPDTHPKGEREVEQYLTIKNKHGSAQSMQYASELEVGLTDQTEAKVKVGFTETKKFGEEAISKTDFDGATFYLVHRFNTDLNNPNKWGVVGEVGISSDERKLEIIGTHSLELSGLNLLIGNNLIAEFASVLDGNNNQSEKESEFKIRSGATYGISPSLRVGLEGEYGFAKEGSYGLAFSDADSQKLLLGPTISYATSNWWATVTARRGVNIGENNHDTSDVRLKIGIPF